MNAAELRSRASLGVMLITSRGAFILVIGLAGYVVLARLLTPRDFGTLAIGIGFLSLAGVLTDGGLGAGLIRRREAPRREELQALTAVQLLVTIVLLSLVAVAAPFLGETAWVTVVFLASMPVVTLQMPARIMLERSLRYRPIAVVEAVQVLTYQAVAIGLVLLGMGVWGVAASSIARAIVGTTLLWAVAPERPPWPKFSARAAKPLLAFGARYQAATATWLARDQGLNWSVAVMSGMHTLGLWSLARRLMEMPMLLFEALSRVSFASIPRLVERDPHQTALVERLVAVTAAGLGAILTALAASAPGLVPGVFGEEWATAAEVLPWTCLAFLISGSIAAATKGYLYAVGDAASVLRASVAQVVAVLVIALPLLPFLGLAAVGASWLGAGVVEAVVLTRRTRRHLPVRLLPHVALPVVVGIIAGSTGWVVASHDATLTSGLAGGCIGGGGFLLGLLVFRRSSVLDGLRLVRHGIGSPRES